MLFLAVLKPDGVMRKAAGAGILKGLIDSGLCKFTSFKQVMVPQELLGVHYQHVSQRPFYPWLVKYMSSYPSYVILLEAEGEKIEEIRQLLGATRAHLADPNSLRGKYCPYGGANGLHLSEDVKAGEYETGLWQKTLGVKPGDFTTSIDSYINENLSKPNNTFALREFFVGVENGKFKLEDQEKTIKDLLMKEYPGGSQEEIDFLYWALTDPIPHS